MYEFSNYAPSAFVHCSTSYKIRNIFNDLVVSGGHAAGHRILEWKNDPHTPFSNLDFSGFNLSGETAQEIRRSAETARSEYFSEAVNRFGQRIAAAYRSATDLFGSAQRMNQAARL